MLLYNIFINTNEDYEQHIAKSWDTARKIVANYARTNWRPLIGKVPDHDESVIETYFCHDGNTRPDGTGEWFSIKSCKVDKID